ncbi:phytoene/squalene synthase family protein [Gammaproteobacteria bacterium LSUCC0057]|uniref:Phytoene/squalene synthase family protein n=1 Tax=Gammaproteobacteria bacterium LSUCC0057 TaxID=2559237 RepID=A0A4Y8UID3_9GAMM|nr:phytoene/squalene synthase family protein [Gammaproteobacteria bacterium LSUCC0057]
MTAANGSAPSNQAAAAKTVLSAHGKSFYWASFFLGAKSAAQAAQLYQFCRYVDDLADGSLPDRAEQLRLINSQLAGHHSGQPSEETAQFLELMQQCQISSQAAIGLVDGMLQDQQPVELNHPAELLRYCHAVAGTVGLMMSRVLGCHNPKAQPFALDLGIAMQLTNIARDVLEDAQMGRRYLPASWVSLTPAEIAAASPVSRQPVAEAVAKTLELAEHYYRSARLGIQLLPLRSRLAIAVALRVYRHIGVRLKGRDYAWWRGRVYVPTWQKLLLTLVSLRVLLPSAVPEHNRSLHADLQGLVGVEGE